MKKNKYFLYPIIIAMLSACNSSEVKNTLGLKKASPDEFNVISNPPLSVPPEFNLPTPAAEQSPSEIDKLLSKAEKSYLSSSRIDRSDKAFFDSLGDGKDSKDNIKKMVDIEHKNQKSDAKAKGIVRKTIDKINPDTQDKVIDPVKERDRIKKNLEEDKPINDGDIQDKNRSSIKNLFN